MSSMNFPMLATDRELSVVSGSFAPNGNAALAAASTYGNGFTVARGGVGTFTITFGQKYPTLVSAQVSLQLNAADDKTVQFGAYSAANKTLIINVWDKSGGAVADIAANANNRIHFDVTFKRVG